MFFESIHSLSENEFIISKGIKLNFPIHIHRSFEYFEQIHGSTEVCVGDQKYVLKDGESVLVFPLQPHSYTSIEKGHIRMCIFSSDIVAEFYKSNESSIPTDNKFICSLPENVILENIFHKKSLAYFICGEFEKGRKYVKESNKNENKLLVALLLFAEKNFCNSCLLRDAAFDLGYDYAYISKFFKRRVGISFRQYINNLRIIESKQLLRADTKSIQEIADTCGFSSLRTFDREFRDQTGTTPSDYRNKHKQP
ncbi:MAG: helix-turn-helix transcriptional regulator [Clostridia bacterium]|nr:helix-turn-helix transcriptional regulator [Clostridia bacterium]